ncbi:MAG: beta-lactamase family protein [Acidobacteria bacterium]|nr:beta-lactamase family protein [Acidobacteriota bacterium]
MDLPAVNFLLGLMAIASLAATAAYSETPDKIDQYIQSEMNRQHIPGLALGVYGAGRTERMQGYGVANVELNVKVKPETIFQSGSVGKQFTAMGIMMLVEEGKIGLDDSILKYFPDGPSRWAPVKVSNLLSHTAGIAEYETEARTKPEGPFYLRLDNSEDELYRKITELPMDFQPGERWRYTNTNYVLLGMMIHRVTGKFYGDFLAERIFRPLEMTATRIISEEDIIPNRASGYRLVKGELKNQEWVSPTYNTTADGALYFNVVDLAKWDGALYTEKLVRRASLDRMWTVFPLSDGKPNSGNYGFAWEVTSVNGHRVIDHGGAWQGFTSYIGRYVNDRLTIVVLTNLDSNHSNPSKIARGVAGLLNPELIPPFAHPIEDKDPQVTRLLSDVLSELAEGKGDPSAFTAKEWEELSMELSGYADFLKELGPLQKLELLERKEAGRERAYKYRATYKEPLKVEVTVSEAGKIANLEIDREN